LPGSRSARCRAASAREGGDAVLSLLAVQLLDLLIGDPDRLLDRAIARVVDEWLPRLLEEVGEVKLGPQVDEEGSVDPGHFEIVLLAAASTWPSPSTSASAAPGSTHSAGR